MKSMFALAAFGAMSAMATPAAATEIVFTTSSGSATDGPDGNIRTFSVGGITVQASAWTYNGTALSNAWLGQYGNGLGVTNQFEGDGQSQSTHTTDNVGQLDFIVLVFNQAVNISSARLNPYAVGTTPADNDAWVSYATLAGAFTATPTAIPVGSGVWAMLNANGRNVTGNLTSPYTTALGTGTNLGNVWVIGASRPGALPVTDPNVDGFKLGAIEVRAVPEPGTWAMMIVGFGAIGFAARRRRSVTVRFAAH